MKIDYENKLIFTTVEFWRNKENQKEKDLYWKLLNQGYAGWQF